MASPRRLAIIGYGQFGQFVHTLQRRYAPEWETVVVTTQSRTDITVVDLVTAAASDVVVLCVPIHRYEDTLRNLSSHVATGTVVVDVATVKGTTETWCQEYLSNVSYLCTHPMFGPASFIRCGNSLRGLRLVVTSHTLSHSWYKAWCEWLQRLGVVLIEMHAKDHDRYLAETLFLTHYIGQVVSAADFVRTTIDTVSFGYLMDAVESVRSDTALFTDVYKYNPYCQHTINRLTNAAAEVSELLARNTHSKPPGE
jgi:prephenate dehydrogenase